MRWFWVDTPYACGAMVVDHYGIVVDACPIYKWALGKRFDSLYGLRVVKEIK